jgi:5-methylcytosine-specific restriction endonuclease McrA
VVINVDHIKPRRKYPELALTESNLQVLCGTCNHGKGSWDETDWRRNPVDTAYEQHKPVWSKS